MEIAKNKLTVNIRYKYVVITPFFPTVDNWRGAYIYDQVRTICKHSDFDVVIFKPCRLDEAEEEYNFKDITVYTFHYIQMPSYFFNGMLDNVNICMFVKQIRKRSIPINSIQFVHVHTGPFAFLGLKLKELNPKIKTFVQHHDLDPYTIRNGFLSSWKLNIRYRAMKSMKSFQKVDLHICISTPVLNSLLSFPMARPEEVYQPYLKRISKMRGMTPLSPKHVYVLYNGVDKSLFYPKTNMNKTGLKIGCIANFQDLKQHMTLLKALSVLKNRGYKDITLSLIGTGETKSQCIDFIKKQELTDFVFFEDEVFHEYLPDYYRALDLFVLPSVFEGFGCVYTEAYACGTPFVGCVGQGAAELMDESQQEKWLIKPYDHMKLASVIEDFYTNRNRQYICKEIDLDCLVMDFLSFIKTL